MKVTSSIQSQADTRCWLTGIAGTLGLLPLCFPTTLLAYILLPLRAAVVVVAGWCLHSEGVTAEPCPKAGLKWDVESAGLPESSMEVMTSTCRA